MELIKNIDKKYIFITLQILFFIFILLPMFLEFINFFISFIFLILEITSFIPILCKKNIKYSILIWQFQIYAIILINLIIQPEIFLQVEEIATISLLTLLILGTLVEITISLLIIFGEKMVKPVLIGLSSSTTLIVFLIVIFVANEGLHTFEETNPVDFVTGTEWVPLYDDPSLDTKTVTVILDNYNVDILPDDDTWTVSPNRNYTFDTIIKNSGGLSDQYTLEKTSSNNLSCNISQTYFELGAGEQQKTSITFYPEKEGLFQIQLTCISNNSDNIEKKTINIQAGDYGVNFYPKSRKIKADVHNVGYQKAIFKITNTGNNKDIYEISMDSHAAFNPKINELDDWNYTTRSGTISLEPSETMNLTVKPIMTNEREGEYILDIIIASTNDLSVKESASILFEYVRNEKLLIENKTKVISEFDTAVFSFSTDFEKEYDVIIDSLPDGWKAVIKQDNNTILSGIGESNISVYAREHAFTLEVYANDLQQGSAANITVQLGDRGSSPAFGISSFILSSFLTTIIAIAIAVPLGLFIAIFLSEFCNKKISPILRFIFDLLAGIPSVVYGFWGFFTLVPLFGEEVFPFLFGTEVMTGRTILTASFVLSIMILPIIIALSNDAIKSVEKSLSNGSLAIGATKWQTVKHIILPKAKSGIVASIILATGRAVGETMAVLMILGGTTNAIPLKVPDAFLSSTHTMTSAIAQFLPDGVGYEKTKYALFGIALILFVIIFALNIIVYYIQKEKSNKKIFRKIFRKINSRISPKVIFKLKKLKRDESVNKTTQSRYNLSELFTKEKIQKSTTKEIRKEKIVKVFLFTIALISTSFLFFILGDIIINGITGFKIEFLTETETLIGGGYEGGFANAIVGSLQLVAIGLAVSVPLSLGSAIYIVEYAKKSNIFTRIILFTSDTLASTPSIVFGAFGFIFIIIFLQFDKSIFAGGLTLGFMAIPLLLRSNIEALKSVPDSFREGSYALGGTKWQTIRNVVLPPASPGISSGLILGIGRAIGETAAILFTAGYFVHFATSILQPAASLPNLIYQYYKSASVFPGLEAKLYSAVLVLIIIVIILNLTSKLIARRSSKMMKN